jgi:iron complex transport system ATP-binding protein
MTAVQVENLSYSYPRIPVLRDLSFTVAPGTLLAILGPNGCGKTTLLHLLAGLLTPQFGSIRIADRSLASLSVRQRAQTLSLVGQEYLPAFDFSVYETVLMGRTARLGPFGFESPADRLAVSGALRDTDTLDLADRRLDQLSSGQRQRVFIARALAQDTPIVLLDEPTAFLDLRHQLAIFDLLSDLKVKSAKTLLLVTHDLNLAARYADTMLFLGSGQSSFIGPVSDAMAADRIDSFFGVSGFSGRFGDRPYFIPASARENLSGLNDS